jgi:hypothetical protein
MKPTPCEHEWYQDRRPNGDYISVCRYCRAEKPTPEEKWCEVCDCKCGLEHWSHDVELIRNLRHQNKKLREQMQNNNGVMDLSFEAWKQPKSSPSPEARVDWEGEAREIVLNYQCDGGEIGRDNHGSELEERIAKALSEAFEKGREAR